MTAEKQCSSKIMLTKEADKKREQIMMFSMDDLVPQDQTVL